MADRLEVSKYLLNSSRVRNGGRLTAREEAFYNGSAEVRVGKKPSPRTPEPKSQDKEKSRQRKRLCGGRAHWMPAGISMQYTEGERSVLAFIVALIKRDGRCDWSKGELASKAGVSVRTVYTTITKARDLKHLSIQYRRRRDGSGKSFTNVLRMACKEWFAWLKRSKISLMSLLKDLTVGSRLPSAMSKEVKEGEFEPERPQNGSGKKLSWRQRYDLDRRRGEDG